MAQAFTKELLPTLHMNRKNVHFKWLKLRDFRSILRLRPLFYFQQSQIKDIKMHVERLTGFDG